MLSHSHVRSATNFPLAKGQTDLETADTPSTGVLTPQDRVFQMRVSEQFLRMVDDWRRSETDLPPRAEAIRRLVELAAKRKKPDIDC